MKIMKKIQTDAQAGKQITKTRFLESVDIITCKNFKFKKRKERKNKIENKRNLNKNLYI